MPTMPPPRRTRNQRLGFTIPQQILFRPLVKMAWGRHCLQEKVSPTDADSKRQWYEEHLSAATGKLTTNHCNRTGDFEAAMAHFEALAQDGVKWQLRAGDGDLRRARHGLQEFCREHDVEDHYIAGMARQMFDRSDLERLNPVELRAILAALKIHLRRRQPQML